MTFVKYDITSDIFEFKRVNKNDSFHTLNLIAESGVNKEIKNKKKQYTTGPSKNRKRYQLKTKYIEEKTKRLNRKCLVQPEVSVTREIVSKNAWVNFPVVVYVYWLFNIFFLHGTWI